MTVVAGNQEKQSMMQHNAYSILFRFTFQIFYDASRIYKKCFRSHSHCKFLKQLSRVHRTYTIIFSKFKLVRNAGDTECFFENHFAITKTMADIYITLSYIISLDYAESYINNTNFASLSHKDKHVYIFE